MFLPPKWIVSAIKRLLPLVLLLVAGLFSQGCTHVPVAERGLVSKPNVAIDRNFVFDRTSRLLVQTEPGGNGANGSGGGCTSCK